MREGALDISDRYAPAMGSARRLAYVEWGEEENPRAIVCVHELNGTAHDFDFLAEALATTHRVICVDLAGRGGSDRLRLKTGYRFETHIRDVLALLDHLRIERFDWIGSSFGGVPGLLLAGHTVGRAEGRVTKLVLNDIGPFIPAAGISSLVRALEPQPDFRTRQDAEAYQLGLCPPWGEVDEARRAQIVSHRVRERDDGRFIGHADPVAVEEAMTEGSVADIDLWAAWEAIDCPVLALRGENSAILSKRTAAEMNVRTPHMTLIEVPGVGHPPSLADDTTISAIVRWLRE